jgi:large subunit ribosomal protein L24e
VKKSMVNRRVCSFCGNPFEVGTGTMFIRKDGSVLYFCSSKCEKNMLKLKRIPRKVLWTQSYKEEKKVRVHMVKKSDETNITTTKA